MIVLAKTNRKNQIIANIIDDKIAISVFKKLQQRKKESDKTWAKQINLYFIWWDMRPVNNETQ